MSSYIEHLLSVVGKSNRKHTSHKATTERTFIKTCPPSPRSAAYKGTKGWGALYEKRTSIGGWQLLVYGSI